MKHLLLCLVLLVVLLPTCNKKSPMCCTLPTGQSILGKWKWVGSGFAGNAFMVTPASGVSKTLEFDSEGNDNNLVISHTDAIQSSDALVVSSQPTLLPVLKVDGGAYTLGTTKAGCANSYYPSLKVLGTTYQCSISNDSLYIGMDPCLAPYQTVYVRP